MRSSALTERETDAAHLHPYHGERALLPLGNDGRSVAALVLRHHERLDGTGYHRYAKASDLSPAARILAAAEAFHFKIEITGIERVTQRWRWLGRSLEAEHALVPGLAGQPVSRM